MHACMQMLWKELVKGVDRWRGAKHKTLGSDIINRKAFNCIQDMLDDNDPGFNTVICAPSAIYQETAGACRHLGTDSGTA